MTEQRDVLITELQHCKDVVDILSREKILAVHALILDKHFFGELTSLLVGTYNGDVYIFDLQENVARITDGGLKSLLESDKIVKVMKGCRADSYILHHQCDVTLQNVFDVKIADDVLEEHKGRLLFQRLSIQNLCEKHSTYSSVLAEHKEKFMEQSAIQMELLRIRPLTANVLSSTANLVRALIPDLYEKLKGCIEENNLCKQLEERTEEEIRCCQDFKLNEQLKWRRKENVWRIIESIDSSCDKGTKYSDFAEGSEEMLAISRITQWEADKKSPFIERLKMEQIESDLDQLEREINNEYHVPKFTWQFLCSNEKHPDAGISSHVKDLQKRIKNITLERIEKTCSMTTNLKDMETTELWILESLFLKSADSNDERQFSQKIARLFWLVIEKKMDNKIQTFDKFKKKCKPWKPFYEMILYYADWNGESGIPGSIHEMALRLKRDYEQ